MAVDQKYAHVNVELDSDRHPLNSSDEPVFVLRAQDALAIETMDYYRDLMKARDIESGGVTNAINKFKQWQLDNQDKIKNPD